MRLLRNYLFWAMGKIGKGYILKSFEKKSDRDSWVNEDLNQREIISSNDPLVCKARREDKRFEPCEIQIED